MKLRGLASFLGTNEPTKMKIQMKTAHQSWITDWSYHGWSWADGLLFFSGTTGPTKLSIKLQLNSSLD